MVDSPQPRSGRDPCRCGNCQAVVNISWADWWRRSRDVYIDGRSLLVACLGLHAGVLLVLVAAGGLPGEPRWPTLSELGGMLGVLLAFMAGHFVGVRRPARRGEHVEGAMNADGTYGRRA